MRPKCTHVDCPFDDCDCLCHQAEREGVGTLDFSLATAQIKAIGEGLKSYFGTGDWVTKRDIGLPHYAVRLPLQVQKHVRSLVIAGDVVKAADALLRYLMTETTVKGVRDALRETMIKPCD